MSALQGPLHGLSARIVRSQREWPIPELFVQIAKVARGGPCGLFDVNPFVLG
jgi:hypothetical protein